MNNLGLGHSFLGEGFKLVKDPAGEKPDLVKQGEKKKQDKPLETRQGASPGCGSPDFLHISLHMILVVNEKD